MVYVARIILMIEFRTMTWKLAIASLKVVNINIPLVRSFPIFYHSFPASILYFTP